jgi:hypothetical protein
MSKSTPETTAIKKEAMIGALEASFGNVTQAARMAKINVTTHYRWVKEDSEYDDRVRSIKDICFQKVRDKLMRTALKRIDSGDSAVLNKMIGIYFKNVPQEMDSLSLVNRPPLMAKIRYAPKPDWGNDTPGLEEGLGGEE